MTSRRKILIVEDERIIAYDIEFMLQELGYHVVGIVASGDDACLKAANLHPDLILMDIKIRGEKDGIETATSITQMQHVPILFVSAYSDEVTMQRLDYMSNHAYISKPFNQYQLASKIEEMLTRIFV